MIYLIVFGIVIVVSIVLRIASALGLSVPLAYGILAPTLFYDWFHENPALAEGVGYALLGLAILCWLISIIGKIAALVRERREDKAAEALFLYRLRQAKAQGIGAVSAEGLWRVQEPSTRS